MSLRTAALSVIPLIALGCASDGDGDSDQFCEFEGNWEATYQMQLDASLSTPGCLAEQHTCDWFTADDCGYTINCSNSVTLLGTLDSALVYSGSTQWQGATVDHELHLNPNSDTIQIVYTDQANFHCVFNGSQL